MQTLIVLVLRISSLAWLLVIGYSGWSSLPVIPLDVSPNDETTLSALNAARQAHLLRVAAVAFVPAAFGFALSQWLSRRSP